MTIERTNNEILIRISETIDIDDIQRTIDYIRYKELTSKSKARQSDVNELAETVNENWLKKNKDKYFR